MWFSWRGAVLKIRNMVQCWSVNNAFVNPTYFLWSPTCKQFVAFTFTFLQLPFNFQAGLIASALYDLHQFFRMISQLPGVCILVSCSLSWTILVSSDKYITILLSLLLNPKLLVNILAAHMMLATIFTLLTYIVFSLPLRQLCNYAVTSQLVYCHCDVTETVCGPHDVTALFTCQNFNGARRHLRSGLGRVSIVLRGCELLPIPSIRNGWWFTPISFVTVGFIIFESIPRLARLFDVLLTINLEFWQDCWWFGVAIFACGR